MEKCQIHMQRVDGGVYGCAINISDFTRMIIECIPAGDVWDLKVSCEDRAYEAGVLTHHFDGYAVTLNDAEGNTIMRKALCYGQAAKYVLERPSEVHFLKMHADLIYPQAQAAV